MKCQGLRLVGTALSIALLSTTAILAATAVQAQVAKERSFNFDISAKNVTQAVNEIGRITGLSVVFVENIPIQAVGNSVIGEYTAREALSRLLSGTGIRYNFSNGRTVRIFNPAAAIDATSFVADGSYVLDLIDVEGQRSGMTEGTGSYTADLVTFGGTAQNIRDVPRSVSVITRQQLQDQNLNSVNEAVARANGVTLVLNDDVNQRTEIFMRGFAVDSLQIDGVTVSSNNDVTTFDTAMYDRLEVLRGPSGVLQGAREPGGTVNLVRKRPTKEPHINMAGQTGSWDRYRAEYDLSAPLFNSDAVRGRFVAVLDSTRSFLDLVKARRHMLYGVLDFDLTDKTTLTVGGTWQAGDGRESRGLPAYADGRLLSVRRSTFAGPAWAHSLTDSAEAFAELNHHFEGGVKARASAIYQSRSRDGKLGFANAAVNPSTGFSTLLPEHRLDRDQNLTLDASVNAPVEIAGLTQTFILGANYQQNNEEMDRARARAIPFDIFHPNYYVAEPSFVFDRWDRVETEQAGLYAQAQLKPMERATILLGGRHAWWSSTSFNRATWEQTAHASIDGRFTPFAGAIFKLTDIVSVYASYASIFVPQQEMTSNREILPAREGRQYEAGLKAALFDGQANATLSVFDIRDSNRAIQDPNDPDYSVASGRVQSRGFEAELTGRVLPNWDLTAGYTYLTTKYIDDPTQAGNVFEPRAPKHSVKLWSKYTFDSAYGYFDGVSIGGGLTAFSDTYRIDSGARFNNPGYAIVDVQLGYQISKNVKANLLVTNLFDKVYYRSVGYAARQNYYGAPRTFALTLNASF